MDGIIILNKERSIIFLGWKKISLVGILLARKRGKKKFFFFIGKTSTTRCDPRWVWRKKSLPNSFRWLGPEDKTTKQKRKKERKKERKKLVTVHQTMDGSNGRIPLVTLSPAGANPSPNSSSSGGIIILFSNTSTSSTNVEGSTLEYLIDAVELLRPPPCLHRVKNCHHLNWKRIAYSNKISEFCSASWVSSVLFCFKNQRWKCCCGVHPSNRWFVGWLDDDKVVDV